MNVTRILPGTRPDADIYALTDSRLSLGRSLEEVASALLGAGVRILQYREKEMDGGEMLEQCRLLRRLTRDASACLIIDDHVDIALLCGADGVHVGQTDIPVPDVRALVGPDMIIGLSTHSPDQARAAAAAGADYIGVGPIFATRTKRNVCAPVTLDYLDWVAGNISLPFVAIGGIKEHNIAEVARHGAKCCALVSELVGAPDIAARVDAPAFRNMEGRGAARAGGSVEYGPPRSVLLSKVSAAGDPVFRPAGFTLPPERPQVNCGCPASRFQSRPARLKQSIS